MKYLLIFVAFVAVIAMAFGADCEINGQSLKVGETYTPIGECTIFQCQSGGGITAKTCPAFATEKPCDQKPDLSKPYPECCPKPDC